MKKILIIITILCCNYALSQGKRDTIEILQKNIKLQVERIDSNNPRIGYFTKKYFVNTTTNQPLNGFYKVTLNENSFYTANYENGLKSLSLKPYVNIIKYYNNNMLNQIDYYYPIFFTSQKYISIPDYVYKSNIFFNGLIKDCSTNDILEKVRVYQKIKKKTICWKIYYPNKTIGKLGFKKTLLEIYE